MPNGNPASNMQNMNAIKHKDIPQNLSVFNFMKIFSFLIPILLIFCILLYAIFANNLLKGLVFLSGIAIVVFINTILKNLLKEKGPNPSIYCNFFPTPFSSFNGNNNYSSPSTNATLITFCATYLLYPLIFVKRNLNIFLLFLFFILYLINTVVDFFEGCSSLFSIFLGTLTGILFGYLFYLIIKIYDNNKLNLSNFLEIKSNRVFCNKPDEQKHQCRIVYMNNSYG